MQQRILTTLVFILAAMVLVSLLLDMDTSYFAKASSSTPQPTPSQIMVHGKIVGVEIESSRMSVLWEILGWKLEPSRWEQNGHGSEIAAAYKGSRMGPAPIPVLGNVRVKVVRVIPDKTGNDVICSFVLDGSKSEGETCSP